ncbi:DISARM system phospholipase D-like protein DrmC [Geodermatophilus nigrescens]|uniref:PLD-like domain-containing protein n=1 Tax=Geodermatophilus nigrescens TaxID=1070870 RepID=A0A1M5JPL9_9ACTN|nr:DISARM system phospholipase D-like protein DrmC [Geodermatophilus nigrescens]SHG42507.1 PLD-like domain-containing protein [Geodermatophilus nigrescens]
MSLGLALIRACAELGRELAPAHARAVADALSEHDSPAGAEVVLAVVKTPHALAVVKRLLAVWVQNPHVPGSELGAVLAGAAYAHDLARREQGMELVLSGPGSAHVHARRTDQVLIDLINGTQRSLVLVTYSLSMYAELKAALQAALARGVDVTVLAEDPRDGSPHFKQDPAVALAGLLVRRLRWPKSQRPAGWTSLHAKIAIADEETVLITSANLSEKAAGDNLEAGLLIRDSDYAVRLGKHLESLLIGGVLIRE